MAPRSSINHHLHHQKYARFSPEVETELIENILESFYAKNPLFITLPYQQDKSIISLIRSVVKFWDNNHARLLRNAFKLPQRESSILPKSMQYEFSTPSSIMQFQISFRHIQQPHIPKSGKLKFSLTGTQSTIQFITDFKSLSNFQTLLTLTTNNFTSVDSVAFLLINGELYIFFIEMKARQKLGVIKMVTEEQAIKLFEILFAKHKPKN